MIPSYITAFLWVAFVGYLFILWKKYYRAIKYKKIEKFLQKTNNRCRPSEYFVDAFERTFSNLQVEESPTIVRIYRDSICVATVNCTYGELRVKFLINNSNLTINNELRGALKFLTDFDMRPELDAIKYLFVHGQSVKM